MRMGYTIHKRTVPGYETHGFKRFYLCYKGAVVQGPGFDTRSRARNEIRRIVSEYLDRVALQEAA
jgi:hypothetical protein